MHNVRWAHALALLPLLAIGTASAAENMNDMSNPLADHVKTANARFADVAAAVAEGYSPIACADGAEGGSMGVHYVNMAYLKDNLIDLTKPEAVMYEPKPDGKLELMGVEYITFKGPAALEGHLFNFAGAPNRYGLDPYYELHVWAWKANPMGAFTDMNPDVSCGPVAGDVK